MSPKQRRSPESQVPDTQAFDLALSGLKRAKSQLIDKGIKFVEQRTLTAQALEKLMGQPVPVRGIAQTETLKNAKGHTMNHPRGIFDRRDGYSGAPFPADLYTVEAVTPEGVILGLPEHRRTKLSNGYVISSYYVELDLLERVPMEEVALSRAEQQRLEHGS